MTAILFYFTSYFFIKNCFKLTENCL